MKASTFLANLGATNSTSLASLGDAFVDAVRQGMILPIRWAEVTSKSGGHTAKIMVAQDALQIGEPGDSFRVNASHTTEQQMVDALGLTMPTSKIADLIHEQAQVVLKPQLQPADATMGTVGAMLKYSKAMDAIRGSGGLASTVGKDWILSNHLGDRADIGVNYGWQDAAAPYVSPGGLHLWQQTGTSHDRRWVDYSQSVRLVHPIMWVDGAQMLLWDVMKDPDLSGLVSYEGPIRFHRHPAVPAPSGGEQIASPTSSAPGMAGSLVAFAGLGVVGWMLAKAVMG